MPRRGLNVAQMAELGILDSPEGPTLFADWDGDDTTAWIKLNEGEGTPAETKTGNAATIQTGAWVTVNIGGVTYNALQFDGVAEYAAFPADGDYLTGLTTQGTIDLALRTDSHVNNEAYVGIAVGNGCTHADDSFLFRPWTSNRMLGYGKFDGDTKFGGGGTVADDGIYHMRLQWDTTSGTQAISLFIDDMATAVGTNATDLDDVIQNSGVRVLTFGALSGGNANAEVTIIEMLIRDNIHSEQHAEFPA